MKRLLIISPYFPPVNAADMQRVRMSLAYFQTHGWDAEIITIDCVHSDMNKDPLLNKSIPANIRIHYVGALAKELTQKIGLGSIALRSLWFYRKYVNKLLKDQKFDLIYFSTTQFPVCILGAYWKNKFNIPYVIDMQDAWHTDYYKNKPKHQQPPKYWFSYRLNKFMEPIAMKKVSGLISVSEKYITDLKERYANLNNIPCRVIPFSALETDFKIAKEIASPIEINPQQISIAYVGVVGEIMHASLKLLFNALRSLKESNYQLYKKFQFYFIGTSYAPQGQGKKTVIPIAEGFEVSDRVIESCDRIGFYSTLKFISIVDGLAIIGTDDPGYTASKLYPYILAKKPLLAILHPKSSAVSILKSCRAGLVVPIDSPGDYSEEMITKYLKEVSEGMFRSDTNWSAFQKFTAKEMTRKQCTLFDEVINAT